MAAAARALAVQTITQATAQAGKLQEIEQAQQALAEGDALRASGAFKDAISRYKDALSKAKGELP